MPRICVNWRDYQNKCVNSIHIPHTAVSSDSNQYHEHTLLPIFALARLKWIKQTRQLLPPDPGSDSDAKFYMDQQGRPNGREILTAPWIWFESTQEDED